MSSQRPAILLLLLTLCHAAPPLAPATPRLTHTITVATANLSDNTTQAYSDPGIRILQALRPDIIAIQEFNYKLGTSHDLARRIMGPGSYFARETGGVRLPNGVISRYPIIAHGQWDDPYVLNRRFFWATIAIPGPKPLHVISVHLSKTAPPAAPRSLPPPHLIRETFAPTTTSSCGDFNVTSAAPPPTNSPAGW